LLEFVKKQKLIQGKTRKQPDIFLNKILTTMKKIQLFLLTLLCSYQVFATGVPQGFGYQAVVRDAQGNIISNQPVSMRFSIHTDTPNGPVEFQQTDTVIPNQFGIITVIVGGGTITSGSLDSITWSAGSKFMQVETDITGGVSYSDMGTTQLLSVPYALYAVSSGSSTPGPQGPQGVPGPQGVAGLDGITGATGLQGATGADGAQGPQGATGADGAVGAQGATGAQGPAGADGLMGATGLKGDKGDKGDTGDTGAQGPQGATGAKGDTGADGAVGPQGATGAQGPSGADGLMGATGLKGDKGDKGDTGDTGIQGPQGATGAKGDTGADGAVGPQGATGSQGPAGADGLMGATGLKGDKGDKGDTGDTGAQGPQGATGAKGDTGADGAVGPQGATGAQGPAGADGLMGATGLKGDKGDTGAQGPTGITDSVWSRTSTGSIYNNNSSGKVGINEPNPTADLDVNGFTRLGAGAPLIKMARVTGNMPGANSSASTTTGIDDAKVLQVMVTATDGVNGIVAPLTDLLGGVLGGFEYSYTLKNGVFTVKTTLLNSLNIVGKPYKAVILYEQ
jgi:hypothetical protein